MTDAKFDVTLTLTADELRYLTIECGRRAADLWHLLQSPYLAPADRPLIAERQKLWGDLERIYARALTRSNVDPVSPEAHR